MLRYQSYNIVFQEVPNEVSLAINLSNCPNRCKGCHSPHLQEDKGSELSRETLESLLDVYGNAITCICFMGGDADPQEVERLSDYIRKKTNYRIKTAWYSGKKMFPDSCSMEHFDYLKLGPYIESLGGLDAPESNQHFYKVENGQLIDNTFFFRKKMPQTINH